MLRNLRIFTEAILFYSDGWPAWGSEYVDMQELINVSEGNYIISGSPARYCTLPEGQLVQIISNPENDDNLEDYIGIFDRITKEYIMGNLF